MPRERRQHYVPEFHLGQFATGRRREVWVFDKLHGKYGRRPVASSAFSRDYYALPGATEEERLALERDFARLENLIAPLVRRLAAADPGPAALMSNERINLAGYAALLHVRVPAYRDDAFKRALELSVDPEALGLAAAADFLRSARRLGFAGSDEDLERRRLLMLRASRPVSSASTSRAPSRSAASPPPSVEARRSCWSASGSCSAWTPFLGS